MHPPPPFWRFVVQSHLLGCLKECHGHHGGQHKWGPYYIATLLRKQWPSKEKQSHIPDWTCPPLKLHSLQWKIALPPPLPSPHVLHLSGLILQPPRQITPDIITALVNYCSETSGTITRVQLCHGNYAGWHRCLEDQRTCKLSRRNCRWKRSKEPYLIPFVQLRELIHLGLVRTNTERCLQPTGKA